mmetsp:Transcript_80118/g.201577  ORF Transcript_80118/g.201577 Transcript_80118/m.201577 type:complete len:240 (+) Transcript_80118:441-1160(+)
MHSISWRLDPRCKPTSRFPGRGRRRERSVWQRRHSYVCELCTASLRDGSLQSIQMLEGRQVAKVERSFASAIDGRGRQLAPGKRIYALTINGSGQSGWQRRWCCCCQRVVLRPPACQALCKPPRRPLGGRLDAVHQSGAEGLRPLCGMAVCGVLHRARPRTLPARLVTYVVELHLHKLSSKVVGHPCLGRLGFHLVHAAALVHGAATAQIPRFGVHCGTTSVRRSAWLSKARSKGDIRL